MMAEESPDERPDPTNAVEAEVGVEVGPLVAQPHGGSIWQGRPKNLKVSPGRTPSELRRLARLGFEARMGELLRIAKHANRESDRVKAIDILGKYGLGEARAYDGELIQALADAVRDVMLMEDPRVHLAIELARSAIDSRVVDDDSGKAAEIVDIEQVIRTAFMQEDPRIEEIATRWKAIIAERIR